jgi:hypothetical protein
MQYMIEQDDPAPAPDGTVSDLALSDLQQKIRERVQYLRDRYAPPEMSTDYPALAGINLFDEPSKKVFGRLKFAKIEVSDRFADDRDLPYANFLPSYAARGRMGTRTYGEYLDLYLKGVRPPLLSFDHYPLSMQNRITPDYFSNWAAIRSRALKYRIPSWIFIQSVDFRGTVISPPRRRPNKAELYWQVNVSLAYGAKGIQYFTYWTPDDYVKGNMTLQYGEALISRETGQPTQTYDRAREVNEYLRKVGKQLLPLTSEAVMHTGVKKPKPGVQPFKANNYVKAVSGDRVILGKFRGTEEEPERYFLVVNHSLAELADTELTLTGSVTKVSRFDVATGNYIVLTTPEGTPLRNLSLVLEPGRAELYKLSIA